MRPLHEQSVAELSDLIAGGAVSPVEIAESCLERIAACNAKLNAVVTLQAEQAMAEARVAEAEITRGARRGALIGPVGYAPPPARSFGPISCPMRTPRSWLA
jgi:Asp-tRNA(Asn)/Glu-tRNA(Gln) amidotransferase A subunit family amidase